MSFNEVYATRSPPGKFIMTCWKNIGFIWQRNMNLLQTRKQHDSNALILRLADTQSTTVSKTLRAGVYQLRREIITRPAKGAQHGPQMCMGYIAMRVTIMQFNRLYLKYAFLQYYLASYKAHESDFTRCMEEQDEVTLYTEKHQLNC